MFQYGTFLNFIIVSGTVDSTNSEPMKKSEGFSH